jgi:ubiquitin thioesterase OTU1
MKTLIRQLTFGEQNESQRQNMLIKVNSSLKTQVDDGSTLIQFKKFMAEKLKLPAHEIELMVGFPPKLLVNAKSSQLISELGVTNGSNVTVRPSTTKKSFFQKLKEMGYPESSIISALENCEGNTFEEVLESCDNSVVGNKKSFLKVERVSIPADNSCLFNSIRYLLGLSEDAMYLRQIIAQVIESDPTTYTQDFLDKDPKEYAQWILQPDKWGGEIEISILSNFLEVVIVVIDIRTGISLPYGATTESPRKKKILLLYDGIHYDALIQTDSRTKEKTLQFDAHEEDVVELAKDYANELNQKKQFVNLATGQLICNECFAVLQGEKDAVEHAKTTGHTNFGQK